MSDLKKIENLSAEDSKKIDRIMREAETLDRVDLDSLIIVEKPETGRDLGQKAAVQFQAKDLSATIDAVLKLPVTKDAHPLRSVSGATIDTLREKFPGSLPELPVKIGDKGSDLPVGTEALAKLIRLAAVRQSDDQASVIWDDGINQVVVHPGRIGAAITDGRVRVDIPVDADGLRAVMRIPFSVGSKTRKAGLVMATLDRPAGNAMVARIWGDPLIALAHGALVEVAETMAGASGRDVENKRLTVGGLEARRGQVTIGTKAGVSLRRDGK